MNNDEIMDKVMQEFAEAEEWAKANGYGIANVKWLPEVSEETNCFSCDITQSGKKIGDAKNHGHGGDTIIYLTGGRVIPEERKLTLAIDSLVEAELNRRAVEAEVKKERVRMRRKGYKLMAWRVDGGSIEFIGTKHSVFPAKDLVGHDDWTVEQLAGAR